MGSPLMKVSDDLFLISAVVVKLVDTPDLGSGAARCVGSSPILGTSYVDSYGVRVTCRRFSPRGLVTAQKLQASPFLAFH